MDERVAHIILEQASKDVAPVEHPPDESPLHQVEAALAEIHRRSEAIREKEWVLAAEREERKSSRLSHGYRAASFCRGTSNNDGVARAMGVRHSYVGRLLQGEDYPVSSRD